MKVLIVEDEHHAAKRLQRLLLNARPDAQVLAQTDSVEDTVEWLRGHPEPDLVFMDIQLADGLSFHIFAQHPLQAPVVFTTAFDEYAIQAFKHNGIDYLLKPVEEGELGKALRKYEQWGRQQGGQDATAAIAKLLQQMQGQQYPERFLLKQGQQLSYIPVSDIAYLYSEDSLTFIVGKDAKRHLTEHTLEQAASLLPPSAFFRINRRMILHLPAIQRVSPYFNNRLVVDILPAFGEAAIVSRDRVRDFKSWLGV